MPSIQPLQSTGRALRQPLQPCRSSLCGSKCARVTTSMQRFKSSCMSKLGSYSLRRILLLSERARIATLATAARLPTMYGLREHVEAGGLICYGFNVAENFRRGATFVDKILKGAKAGSLPIELPVRLDLLVNLKTAKSIGLVISESFLVRADEVIE